MKLIDIGDNVFVDPDEVVAVFNANKEYNRIVLSDSTNLNIVVKDGGVSAVDELKRIVETINKERSEK